MDCIKNFPDQILVTHMCKFFVISLLSLLGNGDELGFFLKGQATLLLPGAAGDWAGGKEESSHVGLGSAERFALMRGAKSFVPAVVKPHRKRNLLCCSYSLCGWGLR